MAQAVHDAQHGQKGAGVTPNRASLERQQANERFGAWLRDDMRAPGLKPPCSAILVSEPV